MAGGPLRALRLPSRHTGEGRLTCMAVAMPDMALAPPLASFQPFWASLAGIVAKVCQGLVSP